MGTLQNALDLVESLNFKDKEIFFDIIEKRKIEFRRDEILENATNTFKSIENGTAKKGSIEDLLSDLED